MRRLIITSVVLALCAIGYSADTILGRYSDLTWTGTGADKFASWGSAPVPPALWTPTNMTGLVAWYAVESGTMWTDLAGTTTPANGQRVARWDDKSGHGYHMTNEYGYGLIYGDGLWTSEAVTNHAVLYGDYQSGNYAWFNITYTQQVCYAVFFKRDNAVNYGRLISQNANPPDTDYSSTNKFMLFTQEAFNSNVNAYNTVGGFLPWVVLPNNQKTCLGVIHGGTNAFYYLDGTLSGGSLVFNLNYAVQITGIMDGTSAHGMITPMNGTIVEAVFGSSALSTTERQKLEGYLARKWGLTNSLPADHPYKNAQPYQ